MLLHFFEVAYLLYTWSWCDILCLYRLVIQCTTTMCYRWMGNKKITALITTRTI